jgi:hypothetical protein
VSSLETERRTIGPELVDATQLDAWAGTRDAQGRFPELMRRLLGSTPGISNISVRSGEGVAAPGWDGKADSTGTSFLPRGSLCFEFGVDRSIKAKADQDYDSRRKNALGIDPASAVFVFATPRRWSRSDNWARDRRAERIFADVKVLDGDDVAGWLVQTPAVHHWISEQLGRSPRDAETLETWWQRFKNRTDPLLPPELFLSGRERERDQLSEFLTDSPGTIAVRTEWRDEAIAFICATIDAADKETRASIQPPLIVASTEVWARVVAEPGRMTLLPLFADPDLAAAENAGHHVVVPLGREQLMRGTGIELPRPERYGAAEALEAAGLNSGRASRLSALARRSMPALIRMLSRDPRLARPEWARPPESAIFAPLALAGAWASTEDDRRFVGELVGRPSSEIERVLLDRLATDDPPFVRPASEWHLASPEEAFLVLRDAITPSDLERWHGGVVALLLEVDPRLDLPAEERYMAGVMGIQPVFSSTLRRGLADGLALVGSTEDERLSDGYSGAEHAGRVVYELLQKANEDETGSIWSSLSDVLPRLAEASPETFLDAVHADLDSEEPRLVKMFRDHDQTSALYTSSPHTGLLWALETLCWSPDFLVDATRALARLAELDPGGRLSNRPLGSLAQVLVGWIKHTRAPLETRITAIEQACRQHPNIGWKLLLALWPSHHATAMPPSAPHFRDWAPQRQNVQVDEWLEFIRHLVRLALELASDDAHRWPELVGYLGPLPPTERGILIDALEALADTDELAPDDRLTLWEAAHKEVAQHRQFASAEWAMDEGTLERLQTVVDRLEPTTASQRFAYLFDWRPDLPGIDALDHVAHDQELARLREGAVAEILEVESIAGLQLLAERVPVPAHLGDTIGIVAPEELTRELATWLDSESEKLGGVAIAWAARKLHDQGLQWLQTIYELPELKPIDRRIAVAVNAPPGGELWDYLEAVDPALSHAYWSRVGPWRIEAVNAPRAARAFVEHGRPWVAVDVLASKARRETERGAVTAELVHEVLRAALGADPSAISQTSAYEIGALLDFLEQTGAERVELARYEFLFFRLLDHHRHPKALFATLGADPKHFVDLVQRAYRGKHERRREGTEQEQALARQAWWVLHAWNALPGQREDGSVDADLLKRWVRDARYALAETDRADIGDEQIGQVLAASPTGPDGIWPVEPVREIIETIGSTGVEAGIHVGVRNRQGVTSRGIFDGGDQERVKARRYRDWATAIAPRSPRTSRVLRGIADSYDRDGRREDERARLAADTE